jgi:hypothetical protein
MVLYLCVLIVFSLRRESLKLILVMDPFPRWFCHIRAINNPYVKLVITHVCHFFNAISKKVIDVIELNELHK